MNKNSTIITIIVVGFLLVFGYVIWSAYNPSVVPVKDTTTTDTTTTVPPVASAGAPIVGTSSVTAPYISTVVVKGTVNPNGASSTYWFEYGKTNTLGTQTTPYTLGSGYTTIYTPTYITGLASNTTYYFRLVARNSFGTKMGTIYSFATNSTPALTGVAPVSITSPATDITNTTVNVHGKVNPSNSATTFWFEYGTTSEFGNVTSLQSAGSDNASISQSVSLSDLKPLTKYYFRLNSQNQFGTINGEILNFTTKGPAAALAPTANTNSVSAILATSAKFNATINANGAPTTYWFEYSNNAVLSTVVVTTTSEQSLGQGITNANVSSNASGLIANTKYYVRVVAKNNIGTVRGDIVSFTTKK